jgi:hypothetical protein
MAPSRLQRQRHANSHVKNDLDLGANDYSTETSNLNGYGVKLRVYFLNGFRR